MYKKLAVTLCILFLVLGVASATEDNSTDDALKIDEKIEMDDETLTENQKSVVTVKFVNSITGEEYGSQTNTISEGGSWGIGMAKFNNMIANHKTFKLDGYKYTFTHWSDDDGIVEGTQRFYCTGEDYTVTFYANYDRELLGRLTFIVNDEHGHNSHYMTYNDEADYKFTFKEPVDVEEGYEFLYYENSQTGETYNPGDVYSMKYVEFAGKDLTIEMNAIYKKVIENNTSNDTNNENNTSHNQTLENETGIINNTMDYGKVKDTIGDNGNQTVKNMSDDNSTKIKDDKNTSRLIHHKTGNDAIVLIVILIILILVISYYHNKE